ncbi:O-acetyl-ADP-ribose deacetylase [Youngiibacter multivorans]|uniref:O-acetyl-ADP-ribose deacetylase (Regulator of RNase III) n=1 Tax=Youngiibacter multivorans TaxID=937251 RepID=A0ABS4G203_9CLOT|nr:O-acetyl-ADP-ribose deacetylase [Youngiibacter multivorans]MBP1918573.1 O-acetyl-ADP-ribose deacetylase (regulator of RNase III) [Youngiibacter multivorans]
MDKRIEIVKGDITQLNTDAIVNAANSSLLGGGGVDGAIHRAAGPGLLEECRSLNGCRTGEAKITKGYSLKARHVIHTVGPIYRNGQDNAILLRSCYLRSLELAVSNGIKSIAFPSISTGVYGYPLEEAAMVALTAVNDFLGKDDTLEKVVMVCFDDRNLKVLSTAAAGV